MLNHKEYHQIGSSQFQALGSWGRGKRESERKNEGGLRRGREGEKFLQALPPRLALVLSFRLSPTTESLEQAKLVQSMFLYVRQFKTETC